MTSPLTLQPKMARGQGHHWAFQCDAKLWYVNQSKTYLRWSHFEIKFSCLNQISAQKTLNQPTVLLLCLIEISMQTSELPHYTTALWLKSAQTNELSLCGIALPDKNAQTTELSQVLLLYLTEISTKQLSSIWLKFLHRWLSSPIVLLHHNTERLVFSASYMKIHVHVCILWVH